MTKKKETLEGTMFDKIFNGEVPTPNRKRKTSEETLAEGMLAPPVPVRPLTVILGREWDDLLRLGSYITSDSVNRHFTRVINCPESKYHISDFINEIFPIVVDSVKDSTATIITTMSVPIIEEIKLAIKTAKLLSHIVVFLYVEPDGVIRLLQINEEGKWLQNYPDQLYALTKESLSWDTEWQLDYDIDPEDDWDDDIDIPCCPECDMPSCECEEIEKKIEEEYQKNQKKRKKKGTEEA